MRICRAYIGKRAPLKSTRLAVSETKSARLFLKRQPSSADLVDASWMLLKNMPCCHVLSSSSFSDFSSPSWPSSSFAALLLLVFFPLQAACSFRFDPGTQIAWPRTPLKDAWPYTWPSCWYVMVCFHFCTIMSILYPFWFSRQFHSIPIPFMCCHSPFLFPPFPLPLTAQPVSVFTRLA